MSKHDQKSYWAQAQKQKFCSKSNECWLQLAKLVTDRSFSLNSQVSDGKRPFDIWWQSCFELLAPLQVRIVDIHYLGTEFNPEYIELLNDGPAVIDMSGWRINAGNKGQDFTFPKQTLLEPGQLVRVYTDDDHNYFNFGYKKQQIWNNKGDTGILFNSAGEEVSVYSYGEVIHPSVDIVHIEFDGKEFATEVDEYVEIRNSSGHWVDVSGWKLTSQKNQAFTFYDKAKIPPSGTIRVYTNQIHPRFGGFSFGSGRAIWNNNGDSAMLSDVAGNAISQYTY